MSRKRVLSDGLWVAGGQILSAVALLISVRVLTEYLSPADYGLMMLIVGTASATTGVAIGAVGDGILVNYSRFSGLDGGRLFRMVVGRLCAKVTAVTVLTIVVVGSLVASITDVGWTTPFMIAALFAVDAARYFELMLFTAARRQRAAALVQIGDAWLRSLVSWLAVVAFHADAYTAIIGNLSGGLIVIALIRLTMHPIGLARRVQNDPVVASTIRAEVQRLFIPLMPARLLANVSDIGGRYVVAATLGLAAAGIYAACQGLARRPFGMLNAISDWSMKPVLAQAIAARDSGRATQIRLYWPLALGLASAIGALLFFLLRQPAVDLLMGERYTEAVEILPVMAAGIGILTIANVFNSILIVEGETRAVLLGNLAGTIFGLSATFALSWLYGLTGAAVGVVIGSTALAAVACGAWWAAPQNQAAVFATKAP